MPKQITKKIYSINTLQNINKTAINKLSHSTQIYDRILNSKLLYQFKGKDDTQI